MIKKSTSVLIKPAKLNKKTNTHHIILWNDDFNSFEWIEYCLVVYCNHELGQARQCASIVHNNGKCSVKVGEYKNLKMIAEELLNCQINVTLEKLENIN